jgi:hypothetical protein
MNNEMAMSNKRRDTLLSKGLFHGSVVKIEKSAKIEICPEHVRGNLRFCPNLRGSIETHENDLKFHGDREYLV